jgi:propanol-preferring alcohol dehydrogenase
MDTCHVMLLRHPGLPLEETLRPLPRPGTGQVRVRVEACGVCRTDLHIADGELAQAKYPVVPGHEVVGIVDSTGAEVTSPRLGERVGVPWLGQTCGHCPYCLVGRENLCAAAEFTGCTRDGGYATHLLAAAAWCIPLSATRGEPAAIAPLLCAGLIGWRAMRAAGACRSLGLYGFGAAAHILVQIAISQGIEVYAFTRSGDFKAQQFARELGAVWAGDSDQRAPCPLDAAIIFAPSGELVPRALSGVCGGGRVVCAGIHMSDIPSFPYHLLWQERQLVSVANLTREDATSFFADAAKADVRTHTTSYRLADADMALAALREGRLQGAAVLVP